MQEIWNEPNTAPRGFWTGSKADYFRLYAEAARAIKNVSPKLRVGGPATCAHAAWIEDLRNFTNANGVELDFITTQDVIFDIFE